MSNTDIALLSLILLACGFLVCWIFFRLINSQTRQWNLYRRRQAEKVVDLWGENRTEEAVQLALDDEWPEDAGIPAEEKPQSSVRCIKRGDIGEGEIHHP